MPRSCIADLYAIVWIPIADQGDEDEVDWDEVFEDVVGEDSTRGPSRDDADSSPRDQLKRKVGTD